MDTSVSTRVNVEDEQVFSLIPEAATKGWSSNPIILRAILREYPLYLVDVIYHVGYLIQELVLVEK